MNLKQVLRAYGTGWLWHLTHAFAVLLLALIVFERLVPGAVLGHVPLFVAVPLFLLCLTVQPVAETRLRRWALVDLWGMVALCLVIIWRELLQGNAVAWVAGLFASLLCVAFLWVFVYSPVDE